MGNPKIKNNIISSTLRQEMKKEYELGISLREISFKHNISYGSLRNYASNHGWVKGSKSVLIAAQELILETEELAKQREEIKKQFRDLTQRTINLVSQSGLGIRQRFVNFSANRFISLFETIAKKYILSESL